MWSSSNRPDSDECARDGDDCRASRCCAQEGSRCFVKNHHWASCNETCHSHRTWETHAPAHSGGHWRSTHHRVWSCRDITVSVPVRVVPAVTRVVTTPTPEVEIIPQVAIV